MTDPRNRQDRKVELRAEHNGADWRFLTARLTDAGDLELLGQDLGPATALVGDDGEYEWVSTIRAGRLPELLHILGAGPDDDVLDELAARWTGESSYELESRIREAGLARTVVV